MPPPKVYKAWAKVSPTTWLSRSPIMVPVDCLAHFWDFGGLVQVKITTTDNQVRHSTIATTRGDSLDDLMLVN